MRTQPEQMVLSSDAFYGFAGDSSAARHYIMYVGRSFFLPSRQSMDARRALGCTSDCEMWSFLYVLLLGGAASGVVALSC